MIDVGGWMRFILTHTKRVAHAWSKKVAASQVGLSSCFLRLKQLNGFFTPKRYFYYNDPYDDMCTGICCLWLFAAT